MAKKTKKEHYQIKGGKEKVKLVSSAGGIGNLTYREAKEGQLLLECRFLMLAVLAFHN